MQTGKLRGGDIGLGDFFGESGSIGGDRVLIGAHAYENNYINSGAAYACELADDMWDETKYKGSIRTPLPAISLAG